MVPVPRDKIGRGLQIGQLAIPIIASLAREAEEEAAAVGAQAPALLKIAVILEGGQYSTPLPNLPDHDPGAHRDRLLGQETGVCPLRQQHPALFAPEDQGTRLFLRDGGLAVDPAGELSGARPQAGTPNMLAVKGPPPHHCSRIFGLAGHWESQCRQKAGR